jgi:sulfite reductase (ferredoxin)
MTNEAGENVEGFQVHLGGSLGDDHQLARKTRQLRVTAEELPDYVERLGRRYLEQRTGSDESFASWARRVDEEALR